jgi:hypothetical protein
MTKLCHGPTIQSVGRLGFDQFPLWRWGTVQPSSSMKHSFSPARSSVAEGTLPADPYFAFLVKLATFQSGRKCERQGLCQSSSGEWKVSRVLFCEVRTGSCGKRPCPPGRRDHRGRAASNRQRAGAWLPLNKRRKSIYTVTQPERTRLLLRGKNGANLDRDCYPSGLVIPGEFLRTDVIRRDS